MLFLSVGENCLCGVLIKRMHIQNTWSTPYTYARSNIAYAVYCEETDYAHLLDKENIIKDSESLFPDIWRNAGFPTVEDGLFDPGFTAGFEFTHHDVIDNIEHKDSYLRKINRMIDLRKQNEDVVFFYHHRYMKDDSVDKILDYCSRFLDYYDHDGRKTRMVIINQKLTDCFAERRIEINMQESCAVVEFYTLKMWAGEAEGLVNAGIDDDLVCEMFVQLHSLGVIDDISFLDDYYLSSHLYFNSGIDTIEKKLNHFLPDDNDQTVYIWGSSPTGLALTDYLVKRGHSIKGIIDSDESKHGSFNEVPIISPADADDCSVIIIAAQKERTVSEIQKQITLSHPNSRVALFRKDDLPRLRYYDYACNAKY